MYTRIRALISTLAVAAIAFTQMLDTSVVNVSLPIMAIDFHLDSLNSGWIITSFGTGLAIGLLVSSNLASRWGEVNVFVFCSLLFALVSVLCAMSAQLLPFLLLRLLQGLLSGLVVATSQYVIVETMPPEKRAFALSIWGGAISFAPTLGPLVGAIVTESVGWPWLFYLNLPLIIFALLAIDFKGIHNSGKDRVAMNWPALFWVSVFVLSLQLVVDFGEYLEWFKSDTIFFSAIIALISVMFFFYSNRGPNKLFDFGVFNDRQFLLGTLTIVCGNSLIIAALLVVPIWLQRVYGLPILEAGMIVASSSLISAAAAPFIGRYMKPQHYTLSAFLSVIVLSFSFWQMSFYSLSSGSVQLYIPRVLLGVGLALFYVPLVSFSMQNLAQQQLVAANAISLFLRVVCANLAIGIALSAIINLQVVESGYYASSSDFYFHRSYYSGIYPHAELLFRLSDTSAFLKVFRWFGLAFALIFIVLLLLWFSAKVKNRMRLVQ